MKLKLILSAALMAGVISASAATENAAAVKTAGTNTSPEAAMTALFGDPVIVKGTGFEIKRSELDQAASEIKEMAAARGMAVPPNVDGQTLQSLIFKKILIGKTSEADQAKAKEQFTTSLQKFKTSQHITDEEFNQNLNKQLVLKGVTWNQWEQQNIEQAAIPIVLARELKINITEAEAQTFYTNHAADFEEPEKVHVRHILLMTVDPASRPPTPLTTNAVAAKRKQIDDLLKQVKAGGDFAALAKQYSEDPGSKANGGELPEFAHGEMVPEFEAAAFSLAKGQISDVITTAYGFHIINLLDKTPAKKVAFATAVTDIKDFLSRQKISKLAPDFIKKSRAELKVEILDPTLKALEEKLQASQAMQDAATTDAPAGGQ